MWCWLTDRGGSFQALRDPGVLGLKARPEPEAACSYAGEVRSPELLPDVGVLPLQFTPFRFWQKLGYPPTHVSPLPQKVTAWGSRSGRGSCRERARKSPRSRGEALRLRGRPQVSSQPPEPAPPTTGKDGTLGRGAGGDCRVGSETSKWKMRPKVETLTPSSSSSRETN